MHLKKHKKVGFLQRILCMKDFSLVVLFELN